eukprot:TRINITY_DN2610_c0_g1_i2.p1 TRINITY_DN2610_c0_g1~~TRINITY_DN2610_c0_g1_i2.p1  ORF type:complete len:249 (+),score=1.17 TRINITY_DN2610_c0_g1_i2:83-748(+)
MAADSPATDKPPATGPERRDESDDAEASPGDAAVEAIPRAPKRHPLQHRWTLWFDSPAARGKGGGWGSSLRSIHTFGSAEEFWCLYNNVNPPSNLPNKADMQVFKEGIAPKWEDPKCDKGGSWTISCARGKDYFDMCWLNLLLAMIGEQFTDVDDVCGAVANVRGGKDRVALWTRNAASEATQMRIGREIKQHLDLSDKIVFQSFADQKNSRNAVQERYTV